MEYLGDQILFNQTETGQQVPNKPEKKTADKTNRQEMSRINDLKRGSPFRLLPSSFGDVPSSLIWDFVKKFQLGSFYMKEMEKLERVFLNLKEVRSPI